MNTPGVSDNSKDFWGTMNIPRVVVTGMGTINPLGLSVDEFWLSIWT
jgi:hypothetical protein